MHLPDGPSKMPSFLRTLRTLRWVFFPLETLELRSRLYGDSFRVSAPDRRPALLYFSSPEALEAIFTAKPEQLSAGSSNAILKPLFGEHGIVLLEGKSHQRQRQLLMPPFHGDRMKAYAQIITAITVEKINQWAIGTPFAVRPAMQDISLRVILSAVFGLHDGPRSEQVRQALSVMLDGVGSPLGFMMLLYRWLRRDWGAWSPWGWFLRKQRVIDELLYEAIRERRATPGTEDVLGLLLSARDEAGQPMTDEELRDELITLLFAGHETTASALAWALYWIAYLPEVRAKLLAELTTLGTDADPSAIARLPYLTAICQETLRLYPIAINAFPRLVKQPITVEGYELEPGTMIVPSIYLAHCRPAVYPDPTQFKPERFLERSFSPYEYLPFGGGDRRCIGSAFALFEMKLVLFTLLSRVELALVQSRAIKPIRRGLTVAPSDHLRMVVTSSNVKHSV